MMLIRTFFLLVIFGLSNLQAQQTLTLEQIMQGPDFVGHLPTNVKWMPNGKQIYFNWNPEKALLPQGYVYNLADKSLRPANKQELLTAQEQGVVFSSDKRYRAYLRAGDVFLEQIANGKTIQVTNTVVAESNLSFAMESSVLVYQQQQNLFAWNIEDGSTKQLTNFIAGEEKKEKEKNSAQTWLERDQLSEFEVLRLRKAKTDSLKEFNKSIQPQRPKTNYLGKHNLLSLSISNDLKFVHYRLQPIVETAQTMVPDYVTESGFTSPENARSKVGFQQSEAKYAIYSIDQDSVYFLKTSSIPDIYKKPSYLKEYHKGSLAYVDTFDQPRKLYITTPTFSEDGKFAIVQMRALDNKDRWIFQLDQSTGNLQLIDQQHDEAWIGGPGISNFSLGFVDPQTIWYQSERTGFSHIYFYNLISKQERALTKGNFEVLDVSLSANKKHFFVHANKEGSAEIHFYKLQISDGSFTQISKEKGRHEVALSPKEDQLAVLYSFSNKPTELYLMDNKPSAKMQQITKSTTAAFNNYQWRAPEIVKFKASDGVEVPARIYEPNPEKKNGAAIIFVHGAGYLQNVHYGWSQYYREYMFHNFLADQGYTVLDIDFRASAGYGRDWRTAIYRHMGGKDLDDQVDGAKFLVSEKGIDSARIGIYGGSYGGFITLMALSTKPGVFASGAALRSVADWAHYNHGYTANILNTPTTDSIAFRRSSPIYHAAGLQGRLLMLHGIVDLNVHFQDVVRLSQRFMELEKDNWELAVYPMEDHGFVESSSWLDEYKRIYKLFTETLLQ